MSSMLEKILLTLFLILGLNVFAITHAKEADPMLEHENDYLDCPVRGQLSLRLEGTIKNGQLLGYIDNKSITWMVTMGNIQGYYNGNFMTLKLEPIRYNEMSLTGWIGSYRVNWRTFGGYFNERIECLR